MRKASESLNYERAAFLRDQIKIVRKMHEDQKFVVGIKGDRDYIALIPVKATPEALRSNTDFNEFIGVFSKIVFIFSI